LRWHVQQWGSSPATLLLLHGTGASTHSWRKLAPLLARRFSVLAPDLPGHGLSAMLPRERRSMAGMALATRELLKSLASRPAGVLGHSAGAALMLRMALDGDLDEAVLIGVNAALLPFEGVAGRLYAPIARLLARSPLPARFAAWRARDVANVQRLIAATGSRLDSQGVALYRGLLRRPDHVAGVLAMMANWDLAALASELPGLHGRLHLLVGESDAIVTPAQAERVAARLRGTAVHRLPGLGHLAHEEAPDRVARIVLDLLPGPPSGGG
jgi:magnesium chelatase accessory protein